MEGFSEATCKDCGGTVFFCISTRWTDESGRVRNAPPVDADGWCHYRRCPAKKNPKQPLPILEGVPL